MDPLLGEGDLDFVRYLNSETGGYAYSELEADAPFLCPVAMQPMEWPGLFKANFD